MDPSSSLIDSLNQVAPPEQVAPQRTAGCSRAHHVRSHEVAIEVDGDDSPLPPASLEVVPSRLRAILQAERQPELNHKLIPSFSFKGTVTKPRPSSSSSSTRVVIPCLPSAVLRDGSYRPDRAYHSTHEDRRDFMGDRETMGHPTTWGSPRDSGTINRAKSCWRS